MAVTRNLNHPATQPVMARVTGLRRAALADGAGGGSGGGGAVLYQPGAFVVTPNESAYVYQVYPLYAPQGPYLSAIE